MVKVGDRIRILKDRANSANVRKGDEFIVDSLEGGGTVTVAGPKNWMFNKASYIVISQHVYSIPADTETVTLKYAGGSTQDIDVKDRARGVAEWVKDGTWVVHKESGDYAKLFITDNFAKARSQSGQHLFYSNSPNSIPKYFRPFTNSDWKWGMWAEYEGEKVFVCENSVIGVYASRKTDPYFFATYSELTPTTAP